MKFLIHILWSIGMTVMIVFLYSPLARCDDDLILKKAGREVKIGQEQEDNFSVHFQSTAITQGHPSFPAEYSGVNSLSPGAETATSLTASLFADAKLWEGGEFFVNPEILAGSAVSGTLGMGGFPNGEVYRVDNPEPKFNLSRVYIKETIGLGGAKEYAAASPGQLAGNYDQKRLTLIVGKFSLVDFFDNNSYSDDPRTQFLNWSIMYNGAWDFAADTRGYTWGMVLEVREPVWSIRLGSVMVPKSANQMDLDNNLSRAHGDNLEFEYRYSIRNHPGIARLMGYANFARMGNYRETVTHPVYGMDITQTREYSMKYGFGMNIEQEMSADLGASLRLGWNDGATETWAFTEIDRSVSITVNLKGAKWNRPVDNLGLAFAVNGLSQDHSDYLAGGGAGFIIGDGRLSYAPEEILEAYYLWTPVPHLGASPDFQAVNHPAYNKDRGPVFLMGMRIHLEY